MFRNFIDTISNICDDFELNVLISHSTLWNGPEEASKFVAWRRMMKQLGLDQRELVHCYMPHFQPPDPEHYAPLERAYRLAWNSLALPQVFKTADLLLVLSPLGRANMVRHGARPERCFLFPGGVDSDTIEHLARSNTDIRARYRIDPRAKLITFIGTLESRKNPLAVARVANRLSTLQGVHFVIAGRPGDQFESVKGAASYLKNVTLLGELSEGEKVHLMRESYLNIIMSRMEALGLAQLEFMYMGIPVITSAVGGQAWLVRDGLEGIHVKGPEDVEGACSAIRELVSRDRLWDSMSDNAKKRARQFTLKKLMRRLESRIHEIIG